LNGPKLLIDVSEIRSRTLLVAALAALPGYAIAVYALLWPLQIQPSLAILIIVVLLAVAFFVADRLIVRESRAVTASEKEREVDVLLKSQQERLHLLSQELMRVQETERRHIARELHDGVGQNLTAVNMSLQIVKASNPELASTMDDCIQTLERILKSVRDLSLDLRPPMIDELGLAAALRWHLANQSGRWETMSVEIHTSIDETRLSSEKKLGIFRIVQEAVSNVVRHANATVVWVSISDAGNEIELTIQDNGHGFDVARQRENSERVPTLGLIGMEERALQMRGRFAIESKAGAGTIVRMHVPVS
jgi:signal transduction histidine kinase